MVLPGNISLYKIYRQTALLHCHIRRAPIRLLRVDEYVDAGGEGGGEGAFERRADIFGSLDEFTVAAQGLDHLVVADAGCQFGGGGVAEDGLLGMLDLSP